jgi:hypothetical protein
MLRGLAVSAIALAALTLNLPPLSAAPELWKCIGMQLE